MSEHEHNTPDPTGTRWRQDNVGRLLNQAARRFEQRVIALMHEKGFGEIGAAHVNLTRHLDAAGSRLTDLAERAAMTKQSMRELVEQTERAGLVERRPDPSDGRAKIIRFTPMGLRWLHAFGLSVEAAEREMREEIGARALDDVKAALARYTAPAAEAAAEAAAAPQTPAPGPARMPEPEGEG